MLNGALQAWTVSVGRQSDPEIQLTCPMFQTSQVNRGGGGGGGGGAMPLDNRFGTDNLQYNWDDVDSGL